jgi:3-hydroxyisobutyryl-CoA hydrolase
VSIYKAHIGKEGFDLSLKKDMFSEEYLADYTLAKMPSLQIAIWNGYVMGGGVGVSIHAPIRIATDNSMFSMPETTIGFFTDVAAGYFLPRVKSNPSLGLYLGLLGHRVKGKEMLSWGLATHFVPSDKIDEMRKDLYSNKVQ